MKYTRVVVVKIQIKVFQCEAVFWHSLFGAEFSLGLVVIPAL
jgi:hypothetical protein